MIRKIAIVIMIIILSGCNRYDESRPIEVIQTKVDIAEAEELLYKAWKPEYDMTIDGITITRCKVKNFDEFLMTYDFSYVSKELVEDIYFRSVALYDENDDMKVDEDGFIIFDAITYNMYIPTIYDERVRGADAYYEERTYNDKFSYLNGTFLVIKEESFDEEDELLGYYRTNYFEEDSNGEWILTGFGGVGSQTPSVP
jgi:hypothetical protein